MRMGYSYYIMKSELVMDFPGRQATPFWTCSPNHHQKQIIIIRNKDAMPKMPRASQTKWQSGLIYSVAVAHEGPRQCKAFHYGVYMHLCACICFLSLIQYFITWTLELLQWSSPTAQLSMWHEEFTH